MDIIEQQRINGDEGRPGDNEAANEAQHYSNEIRYTISEANQLIATLGENNPILRSVLGDAVNEMTDSQYRVAEGMVPAEAYYGRRLMQRKNMYPEYMIEVLVDHPIQTKYRYGIPGVSRETCEGLCDGEKYKTRTRYPIHTLETLTKSFVYATQVLV